MRIAPLACFTAFAIFLTSFGANAAGALATGRCGAFGYTYDDVSPEAAGLRARAQCTGHDCKVGASLRRTCAASATDATNACAPRGWERAAERARAPGGARGQCRRY